MADSLLDNYNPLYDIHLRQYFALPHMQKHLQKMGLLESTLNLNGDEVYARHHAMMDMMLKNREAQLLKMAELRKKLDAAEKVEICRRIRTGQSPESYRRGKPSRSLSRNRAAQKNGNGGRQRRFSNSYEDRDFVQHIEERNQEPNDYDTRDPYKRLSANAKRFNYLHKLDDNTLIAYKDNLKKQLQRLERFREISFGPHSVARQPPPPQASWFFRRRSLPSLTASAPGNTLKEPLRSVLNMRGRKTTTGNKLNASNDSRTSCPPTTRKRKDSNTRLPPINLQKARVPTKPPAPVSLQQITTKLPPAAKKPAPTRGRPSNKRQTTTTTTTTITAVSKPPPTTLPALPSVTGHGIFTGAAAAATVAAIGTAAINMDKLISDDSKKTPTPSPPSSPVLETQKTFDRSSPTNGAHAAYEEPPADLLDHLADKSEEVSSQHYDEIDDHIARQIVLDNTPIDHGNYDSDSEPEYAEEDRDSLDEHAERLVVNTQLEESQVSPPTSNQTQESPKELHYEQSAAANESPVARSPSLSSEVTASKSPVPESKPAESPVALPSPARSEEHFARSPSVRSEAAQSPVQSAVMTESPVPQSPEVIAARSPSVHLEHEPAIPVVAESFDAAPQSPVLSVHDSLSSEQREHQSESSVTSEKELHSSGDVGHQLPSPVTSDNNIPVARSPSVNSNRGSERQPSVHSPVASERSYQQEAAPQSPVLSVHSSHHSEAPGDVPQSPALSVHSSHASEHHHHVERHAESQLSPALSVHAVEHFEQHDAVPQSPVLSVHGSHHSEHHEGNVVQSPVLSVHSYHAPEQVEETLDAPKSPVLSVHSAHASENSEHSAVVPQSPALSMHSSNDQEHVEQAPQSPALSVHSSHFSEQLEHREPVLSSPVASGENVTLLHSPSEQNNGTSEHGQVVAPQSPALSVHSSHTSEQLESSHEVSRTPALSMHSSHVSEAAEHVPVPSESPVLAVQSDNLEHHAPAPESPVLSEKDGFVPRSPSVHTSDASETGDIDEEAFTVRHHAALSHSPVHVEKEIVPQSPVEYVEIAQHSPTLSPVVAANRQSPTEHELYNPSHGNMESPAPSEKSHHSSEHVPAPQSPIVAPASPVLHDQHVIENNETGANRNGQETQHVIADRIDLEAYHNSPTKESTSPVAINPMQIHITAEQVAEHLSSPEQAVTEEPTHGSFEDIINRSADEEASHLIQEALTEAPAIIDMVNNYEERFSPEKPVSPPVHSPEAYELNYDAPDGSNAMTTSIYQPSSDREESDHENILGDHQPDTRTEEWDDGNQHVKETTTHSEYTSNDGTVHQTYSETVTVITDNQNNGADYQEPSPKADGVSPNGAAVDNISTDSLVIHDDHQASDYQMTQSIYQPNEDVEEKEWDEGNKHVHEITSNVEHTDESGKHYTETVTTTTTVIKSGEDQKNNNDDDGEHSDDNDQKSTIEEEEEHGSNGNLVRETITTTTHTVTTGGLPEGGILVDDGDETNVSSL